MLYAGPAQGSTAFVGIVKKGDRYRAYVSDATAKRATLSVWFRGTLGTDGHLTGTAYGVTLDARLERRNAAGTVALPDGRVLSFAAKSGFGGGLVERNYVFDGVRYRSGWIVLEDNRVRGRTTIAGTTLDGAARPVRASDRTRRASSWLRITQPCVPSAASYFTSPASGSVAPTSAAVPVPPTTASTKRLARWTA